jgi:hypothetical protein
MKKSFLLFFSIAMLAACKNDPNARPHTALDTGREFIRASLDGNFKRAESLVLNDTQNIQMFERYKIFYNNLQEDQKQKYKNADYEIKEYKDLNDSTATINYSNSYMHKPMDIKIVRVNKVWSVDFKYTYESMGQ